eukprot:TRINITY_DN6662_c0_g3_i5.p1 TRINITY_DN6662_c0_g3~~TRINITY_DN6662_c0_g3_i5.p1  ORF type:complete len:181 (+),score=35.79 TRINITY_DN6662_c0_g3_i5:117-659(+)
MGNFLAWVASIFWKQEMELAIIGLQNAGKSTFVRVITDGEFIEDMIPTIGFNMHKITKNKVQIKLWDLGGQQKFRSMWERYCRGVQVIIFVMDAADVNNVAAAKAELDDILSKPALTNIPLLVLANKNDLPDAMSPEVATRALELERIQGREVAIYSISCKNIVNIDITMDWILRHAKSS